MGGRISIQAYESNAVAAETLDLFVIVTIPYPPFSAGRTKRIFVRLVLKQGTGNGESLKGKISKTGNL